MVHFNKAKMSVADMRRFDNMAADIERNKAYNDYIAMMCDVDIPESTEETEVVNNEE